jgi:CHAT domain-containing protein
MEKVYDLYEEAVVFMIRSNFPAEAMRSAESMKARVFADQLAEGQFEIKNAEAPEVKARRNELESRIAELDMKLSENLRGGEARAALDLLRRARIEAERALDSLDIKLRASNPLYASVHYPEPISVEELQNKILQHDETLLEFFVSAEGVYCFVVTANSLNSITLPLTRRELEQMSKKLLDSVMLGPSRSSDTFDESASALYDRLLRPLEKMIAHNTVVIVPDGILTRVPFEILLRKDNDRRQSFLRFNAVKYFQSATLLGLQRIKFRKEKFSSSFIGFGDPLYNHNSAEATQTDGASNTTMDLLAKSLVRLEASGKEIQAISEIFEADNRPAKVLLREKASRRNAMADEMKEYGFIHFAAHGVKAGSYQAIALSRTSSASDAGMLSIGDIMSCSYDKSRLVVLSACQSGLGTFDRGEGVTGLTRAVMYSGSPAAVVSLWSVEDRATMTLMENFYENVIAKKMELGQALRSAKLAMIKSDRYSHPLFWGAFVMYGE